MKVSKIYAVLWVGERNKKFVHSTPHCMTLVDDWWKQIFVLIAINLCSLIFIKFKYFLISFNQVTRDQYEELDYTIIMIFLLTVYNVLTDAKPAISSGLVSPNC